MYLHTPFAFAEPGPREQFKAQVNGLYFKGIRLYPLNQWQNHCHLLYNCLAVADEYLSKISHKYASPVLIGIGKG